MAAHTAMYTNCRTTHQLATETEQRTYVPLNPCFWAQVTNLKEFCSAYHVTHSNLKTKQS